MATIMLTILFIGYWLIPKDEGYVLSKDNDQIWVVDLDPEQVQGRSIKELKELYSGKGMEYELKIVPDFIKNKIELGDRVKVFMDDTAIYPIYPIGLDEAFLVIKIGEIGE